MSEDNNQQNGTTNGDVPEIELIIKVRKNVHWINYFFFIKKSSINLPFGISTSEWFESLVECVFVTFLTAMIAFSIYIFMALVSLGILICWRFIHTAHNTIYKRSIVRLIFYSRQHKLCLFSQLGTFSNANIIIRVIF